jgi:DNA invertase Pin-like site-specific DNA recombinase
MPAAAKPLAAIIRSSDRVAERQREGTYHGDQDQLADVERYCKARRLAFELLPPELDVSGGQPIEERPSLRAAIEGVEAGIYSGIVTANLKRLTRSRSGLAIWERVEAAGGHVHTAAEAIDTSTPNGRFMRDVFLADAVREREEHVERHAKRRAATVEAGMWRMRQVPRGYRFAGPAVDGKYIGKARRLVPGRDAADVREAALDVIAGVPLRTIGARLGMTGSGIRAMLRNRLYLGELRDGPNVNPTAHEPILDPVTFDAVGHALSSNPRPARSEHAPALLAGLVRCSACGHVMSRGRTKRAVYRCPEHHSGARCPAPGAITLELLDAYVERIALAELARLSVTASEGDALARAEDAVAAAERELKALVKTVTAAGLEELDFAEELRDRKRAVEDAREALRVERARLPVIPAFSTGAEVWKTLDEAERNTLLRALLEAVIVERAGGRGSRRSLDERVRVIAHGTGLRVAEGGNGKAGGIVPVPLPDLDAPGVLRSPTGEDRSQS